jgi:hypothetical protein
MPLNRGDEGSQGGLATSHLEMIEFASSPSCNQILLEKFSSRRSYSLKVCNPLTLHCAPDANRPCDRPTPIPRPTKPKGRGHTTGASCPLPFGFAKGFRPAKSRSGGQEDHINRSCLFSRPKYNIMADIKNRGKDIEEDTSSEILHLYSGYSEETDDDKIRKSLHNKLVGETITKINHANELSDSINEKWLPKYQRFIRVKKFQDVSICLFGFIIIILGVSMLHFENGNLILEFEQIGVILSGFGIFLTSFYSILALDDELHQKLIILLANENLVFAEFSNIQSQLSYIKNEILDIKKLLK